jgi:hypothetical protein
MTCCSQVSKLRPRERTSDYLTSPCHLMFGVHQQSGNGVVVPVGDHDLLLPAVSEEHQKEAFDEWDAGVFCRTTVACTIFAHIS